MKLVRIGIKTSIVSLQILLKKDRDGSVHLYCSSHSSRRSFGGFKDDGCSTVESAENSWQIIIVLALCHSLTSAT
jgi:hypothetical protein